CRPHLPGAERQAERPRGACAGAQRQPDRLRVRAEAAHHRGRGQRTVRDGGARATGPRAGLRDAAAGVSRLLQRHQELDRRCAEHHGDGGHDAQGLCLVRQRDGLCLPHGRSRQPGHRRGGVMAPATRHYLVVTASYWGFTLVDGALRMLVLLHFFKLGYSPFTLAFLFLLYEFAGIVANLLGGWLATRFGIPRMLAVGQALQIAGLAMLSALDPGWTVAASVAWVVMAQGIAGLAKDFTKTASKSAIKATSAEGSGQLFKWVAYFTGSENALEGSGFLLAGAPAAARGFKPGLWVMAARVGVNFPGRPGRGAGA